MNRSVVNRVPRYRQPAMLLAAILAIGLAVSALRDDPDRPTSITTDADPGVVHVHGLALNPANGELMAATHTGLFRLPRGGQAVRVADRYQDTMAFTVTGPDRFLGSGHPDLTETQLVPEGGRPLLGLIQSIDAGQSWQPLSLLGVADFHSLASQHGLVYGLDSTGGRLLVSGDRLNWEPRAQLFALDLAVSPTRPEVVLASDGGMLLASEDGGRSFLLRPGPELAFVEWPSPAVLWGVSLTGEVYLSRDAGTTWTERTGLDGEPESFLATGDELYASVVDGGIVRSTDAGRRWQLHYANGGTVAGR